MRIRLSNPTKNKENSSQQFNVKRIVIVFFSTYLHEFELLLIANISHNYNAS